MEYIQVFGVVETLEHLNCGASISTILSHVIENIHNQKLANYVSACMRIADCSVLIGVLLWSMETINKDCRSHKNAKVLKW